ncbi:MAG: VTT domain-containing protein [bacterium]|nr:VTT domain-containing protein [bacterium]
MRSRKGFLLTGGFVLMLLLAALLALVFIDEELFIFSGPLSYVTIGVVGAVTNATIFIPAPSMMPVYVSIADQNILVLVAFFYALSAAFGESTAYHFGRWLGEFKAIENSWVHRKLEARMRDEKRTAAVLFLLALLPSLFLFDVGGIIAGNTRYPWKWFFLATFFGRWVKYSTYMIIFWEAIEGVIARAPFLQHAAAFVMVVIVAGVSLGIFLYRSRNGTGNRLFAKESEGSS